MKKVLAIALIAGTALVASTPADARQGCGPGFHRNHWGRCRPNRGPDPAAVVANLVVGNYYDGRGYWDGHRYYHHRRHWHGGWRYY
ncbi:MAG TPA: hypothetical protein VFW19_02830 [Allosphingosinicella sp.]|nr:hypothetical protein [Allosphingosinicella sp.]